MVLEDSVPDFNPKKIVSPIHPYLGCMYGKQYKASYKSDPLKQHSKTPEKFIDGDVSSKVATPSLHGSLYYILYKDDCIEYYFVHFTKYKNDAFPFIKKITKIIKRNSGNKAIHQMTDQGIEFATLNI